jgi:outer membrane receptor protein involved in Fe transport
MILAGALSDGPNPLGGVVIAATKDAAEEVLDRIHDGIRRPTSLLLSRRSAQGLGSGSTSASRGTADELIAEELDGRLRRAGLETRGNQISLGLGSGKGSGNLGSAGSTKIDSVHRHVLESEAK